MLPSKFTNRMKFMLGQECDAFLVSFECVRSKALRINPCKLQGGREVAYSKLPFETKKILWEENGFVYKDEDEPGKHPLHMAGLYYIQEPSAMSPVAYLDPKPGQRVLDLCAAPGGKSTQIAGRMQGRGILVSNEINAGRAKILSENIERMGIGNAMVLNETPQNLSARFEGWFDRILIDAPCSGEGMFRKNEDAVTNWSPENVRLCADRQDEILDNAASMLAPSGRLVYSTCTFAPDEDEGTIYRFLLRHPEFRVVEVPLYEGMDHGNPSWALIDTSDESTWTKPDLQDNAASTHDNQDYGLEGCLDEVKTNKENLNKEKLNKEVADQLANCIRLWPHHLKGEGHFLAVLERVNENSDVDVKINSAKESGEQHGNDMGQKAPTITYCPGGFQRGIRIEQRNPLDSSCLGEDIDDFESKGANASGGAEKIDSDSADKKPKKKLKAKDRRLMDKNAGRAQNKALKGGSDLELAKKLWEEFAGEVLSVSGMDRLYGTLFTFGENVYLAPFLMPSTDRLKVMRPGLHLGTMKKGRFEPSHSLALFLRKEDVKNSHDYPSDSKEIKDFTSGLSLTASLDNGWYLILTDGCSLGWAKSDGRRLKNHYPKGLRINYAD
ncbi:NOL1/NOP2/sun family putative RNA methylase [Butyrivibrio fibrisolvens]|uniref:NOL1/NOP2/sun family putative RNA methylase n=1 Tax=Butyrivibrio fibrisolvens TaxID=831 RepID=A0A1H9LBQ0_BUTFI|nr:RsmB/NOP family class I SAM-dependent RNA methyltransferase [Butyrivibrio fibrisolvens]SER08585.1 NOL1/NOP2/sun family putative RNA methylase [Butyrivibrio fibrisolvens]